MPERTTHDPDDLLARLHDLEAALRRYAATPEGYCPNRGECDESCDCIVCRTQTLITEWEDHPVFGSLDGLEATLEASFEEGKGDQ